MHKMKGWIERNPDKLFKLLLIITISFFILEVTYYIFFLNTWFDEGEFTYKAWLTSDNLAHPFEDFRNKYPSFSFYIQVLFQKTFGPTILGARILSVLFLIGSLILLYKICKKIGNKWIGLLAISLLIFHPYLTGYYSSAKNYSWVIFFSLLSIWFIDAKISDKKKIVFSSISMALSVITRYQIIPALILLWIFIYLKWRNWKYLLVSILIFLIIFSVSLIPYLLSDAKYALIWFLMMFGPLTKLIPIDYFKIFNENSENSFLSQIFNSDHFKFLIRIFIKFFHLWVIFFTAIFSLFIIDKEKIKRFFRQNSILVFNFFLTLILFVSYFIIPNEQASLAHSFYLAPFLIISVAGSINLFYKHLEEKKIWESVKLPVSIFLIIIVLFSTISTTLSGPDIIFFNHFNYKDTDLNRIKHGAEYLKSLTSPKDKMLVIGMPHHALMAERYEFPPLINTDIIYYNIEDSEILKRYKFYNFDILLEWLKNEAMVVVFQRDDLINSTAFQDGEGRIETFEKILNEKYEFAGSIENVYPKKYTIGDGIMNIYRRK